MDIFYKFLQTTGFASMTYGNAAMILIGIVFITLAIRKDYEPLLLVPMNLRVLFWSPKNSLLPGTQNSLVFSTSKFQMFITFR